MMRQQRVWRGITLRDGQYVEKTVTAMVGGGKPIHITKEVVHDKFVLIKRVGWEEGSVEERNNPPPHDAKWFDPSDFSYHYLKRIR